jgi:hypothetical protein
MVAGAAQLRIRTALTLVGTLVLLAACVPMDFGTPSPESRTAVPPATSTAPPSAGVVIRPVPEAPAPGPGSAESPGKLPPTARAAPPISSATQALLNESRSHQAAGRYEQAAASIERALRIEPRQPALWLELGNIRLKEGDFTQAESMGRKALSLSAGDAELTARAEQLIATAKRR